MSGLKVGASGLKVGACVVHNHYHHDATVKSVCVVQADAYIHISDALLTLPEEMLTRFCEYGEGLFVIHGFHGDIRYRLVERVHDYYWLAERLDSTELCPAPDCDAVA